MELEQLINDGQAPLHVQLTGKINLKFTKEEGFTLGRNCVKGFISITRPNVILDGSNAEIYVEIEDSTTSDRALFYIHPSARHVKFQNLNIKIVIKNPCNSTRMFAGIYNTAFGLEIAGCRIEVSADKQINLTTVYNNGNLDTHMETRSDNLVIKDSYIIADCRAEEFTKESAVYALYNYLANSISVSNTFVFALNMGNGDKQKAVGIYTNGRFGRFTANNIKANANHNIGKKKEYAHAFGFVNEGLYTIITSNNIVGEWAGKAIGLENKGEYAKISSNKILSTHTICGRSMRSYADNCIIDGNIITSTSRNARLIEHNAVNCIISKNFMEILMAFEECKSGCGIYAIGENIKGNIITENIIKNVLDCALFVDNGAGIVSDNHVDSYTCSVVRSDSYDKPLKLKLDESRIRSIE